MSNFPILSRFQYDAHVKVVEADPDQTIDELAGACAYHSVGLHVADQPGKELRVRPTSDSDDAPPWPGHLKVSEAGIKFFDCLDIYFDEPGNS